MRWQHDFHYLRGEPGVFKDQASFSSVTARLLGDNKILVLLASPQWERGKILSG
jgi:hypothetical protein